MKKAIPTVFVSLIVLFVCVSNVIWLSSDTTPQRWDESIHLNAAAGFAESLKENPLSAAANFITQESFYPPLVPFIGAFTGLFLPSADNFTLSMLLFHAILILFTFLYSRRHLDILSSFAAVSVVYTFPLIFQQGHFFMFDLPMTAAFILFLYLLDRSEHFKVRRFTLMAGLAAGAGMLIKWNFIFFITAPLLYNFLSIKKKDGEKSNFLIFAAAALVLCLPWYLWNILSIAKNTLLHGYKTGVIEGRPGIFSPWSLGFYFKTLLFQLGFFTLAGAAAGAYFAVKSQKGRKLLFYIIIPVILMILIRNKKARYIMPLLPLAGILTAYAVNAVKNLKVKTIITAVITAACFLNYSFSVYSFPFSWPGAARPKKQNWHIEEIISKLPRGAGVNLAVVADHPYMNPATYAFYRRALNPGIKITGIFNFPMFTDYFLIKTGSLGPEFSFIDKRSEIVKAALDPRSSVSGLFSEIYSTPLPDGSKAVLFKRNRVRPENGAAFEASVNSNIMGLISLYLKHAEKFSFTIDRQEGTAMINKISVKFDKGYAGDFKHKDIGLNIYNAKIEINKLLIDPKTAGSGKLKLLSIGEIEIKSLEVKEDDLKNLIKFYAEDLNGMNVSFSSGIIKLKARYEKIPFEIRFRLYNPYPGTDKSDIFIELKSVKTGFIPLPAPLLNFIIKDFNPLLNKSGSPVRLKYGQIIIEDEELAVR